MPTTEALLAPIAFTPPGSFQTLHSDPSDLLEPELSPAPKKRTFDPKLQTLRQQKQAQYNEALKSYNELFCARHQEFGKDGPLRLGKDGRILIKGSKGQSKVYEELIARILTVAGAMETQTAIRLAVEKMLPEHAVPKDWTKPLPAWARKTLQSRIYGMGKPFSNIKISSGTSLSSLHKAAKAAVQRQQEGVETFRPIITISDDALTINGKAWAISNTQSKTASGKTYSYRHARVNIDELLTHLR